MYSQFLLWCSGLRIWLQQLRLLWRCQFRRSLRGAVETNPTRNHKVAGLIPGLAQWVKDQVAPWAVSGVGCRQDSDLALLWLWCGPAAVAPIRPLAWEPPYTLSVTLKSKKKKLDFLLFKGWIVCYYVYIHTTFSVSFPLSADTRAVSIPWLLWVTLHWTWECRCLETEILFPLFDSMDELGGHDAK